VSALAWATFVVAGAVGAMLRYVVDTAVQSRVRGPFPWGTFVVNISGSFVLGVLTGLALYHAFPEEPRIVLGAGFCGAYTTFSTFSFETVRLLEQDAAAACRNALGTLVTGAGAAALGLGLASL
jgi:CrcB protein